MKYLLLISSSLLVLAATSPAFSQGATMSPPSPNAGNAMPEPSNSVPEGARTMPRGTTGIERMGTLETSGVAVPDQSRQERPAVNPDWPEGKTVPVPRGQ